MNSFDTFAKSNNGHFMTIGAIANLMFYVAVALASDFGLGDMLSGFIKEAFESVPVKIDVDDIVHSTVHLELQKRLYRPYELKTAVEKECNWAKKKHSALQKVKEVVSRRSRKLQPAKDDQFDTSKCTQKAVKACRKYDKPIGRWLEVGCLCIHHPLFTLHICTAFHITKAPNRIRYHLRSSSLSCGLGSVPILMSPALPP